MRDLVAGMRERLWAVFDRGRPGAWIGAGLVVVALVFGALGLAILRGQSPGLDDLGLGSPRPPAAAGEGDANGSRDDVEAGDEAPLASGLNERPAGSAGSSDTAGETVDPGSSASGGEAPGAGGASSGGGDPAAASQRQPSSTVAPSEQPTTTSVPPGTTPTTAPPTTGPATTDPPPAEEPPVGLVGGLLHLLGLGGLAG